MQLILMSAVLKKSIGFYFLFPHAWSHIESLIFHVTKPLFLRPAFVMKKKFVQF